MAKIIYKNRIPGPVYIAESVKSKKAAGIKTVNESVDENGEEDYDGEKKYVGSAYYEAGFRGLEDSIETDDWDKFTEWIDEKATNGLFLDLDNNEDGTYLKLSPERYIELCGDEDGEIVGDIEPSMFEKCDSLDYMERPASKRISDNPEDNGDDETLESTVKEDEEMKDNTEGERRFTGTFTDEGNGEDATATVDTPEGIVAIYDSPDFFDRYTIVYGEPHENDGEQFYDCLGLSENPESSQGFSQWSECMDGDHLGKKIEFAELPENIQKHIIERLSENVDEGADDKNRKKFIVDYYVANPIDAPGPKHVSKTFDNIDDAMKCIQYAILSGNADEVFLQDGSRVLTKYDRKAISHKNESVDEGEDDEEKETISNEQVAKEFFEFIGGREPCVETKEGVIYFQYNSEDNMMEYGGATNTGLIKDGALEYDKSASMQTNIENLISEIEAKYGSNVDEGVREATNRLIEMVDDGALDEETVAIACLKYMSEDDVKDMAVSNELYDGDDDCNGVRTVTNKLLDMAEDGVLSYRTIIDAATRYMSEDSVKDMAEANEFFELDDEDDEEEESED